MGPNIIEHAQPGGEANALLQCTCTVHAPDEPLSLYTKFACKYETAWHESL